MKKNLETKCARIKLKPGTTDKVYAWAEELTDRSSEVYQTLRDEGVYIESVFLEKSGEDNFLIYYMKSENEQKAGEIARVSQHPVDAYHKAFKKECWESGEELELLIDFDRFNEIG